MTDGKSAEHQAKRVYVVCVSYSSLILVFSDLWCQREERDKAVMVKRRRCRGRKAKERTEGIGIYLERGGNIRTREREKRRGRVMVRKRTCRGRTEKERTEGSGI